MHNKSYVFILSQNINILKELYISDTQEVAQIIVLFTFLWLSLDWTL